MSLATVDGQIVVPDLHPSHDTVQLTVKQPGFLVSSPAGQATGYFDNIFCDIKWNIDLEPHLLTWFLLSWICNHMPSKVCDEITYPFPNVNCATVEVRGWISNFISYLSLEIIIYPYWS